MEIERKFLIKELPSLTNYPYKEIVQAYLSTDPVIRLRQLDDSYFLTVKSSGHMAREEFELDITKDQFDNLFKKIDTTPIHKYRYYIPLSDSLTAELDVYKGPLETLVTVEVEFSSLDDANTFTPPDWFGEDITFLSPYKNNQLALNGLPS